MGAERNSLFANPIQFSSSDLQVQPVSLFAFQVPTHKDVISISAMHFVYYQVETSSLYFLQLSLKECAEPLPLSQPYLHSALRRHSNETFPTPYKKD